MAGPTSFPQRAAPGQRPTVTVTVDPNLPSTDPGSPSPTGTGGIEVQGEINSPHLTGSGSVNELQGAVPDASVRLAGAMTRQQRNARAQSLMGLFQATALGRGSALAQPQSDMRGLSPGRSHTSLDLPGQIDGGDPPTTGASIHEGKDPNPADVPSALQRWQQPVRQLRASPRMARHPMGESDTQSQASMPSGGASVEDAAHRNRLLNAMKNKELSDTESMGSGTMETGSTTSGKDLLTPRTRTLTRSASAALLAGFAAPMSRRELAAMNAGQAGVEVQSALRWPVPPELGVAGSTSESHRVTEFDRWCSIPAAHAEVLTVMRNRYLFDELACLNSCDEFLKTAPEDRHAKVGEIMGEFWTHGATREITIHGDELTPLRQAWAATPANTPLYWDSPLATAVRGVRNNLAELVHDLVVNDPQGAGGRIRTIVEQDDIARAARGRKLSFLPKLSPGKPESKE